MSAAAAAWCKANPDRVKASKLRNREKTNAAHRERHARLKDDPEYREAARQRAAAWRAKNREKHRAYSLAWQRENVVQRRLHGRDAARRRRVGKDRTAYEYTEILRCDPCSYCGSRCDHIDHIDSVSCGGTNDWTNLTAACAHCNSTKRSTRLLEFLRR